MFSHFALGDGQSLAHFVGCPPFNNVPLTEIKAFLTTHSVSVLRANNHRMLWAASLLCESD